MPHSAAGMRTEPPVSVPSANAAMPSLTDTAAPEDDPPGILRLPRSEGFAGGPDFGLTPTPVEANPLILARAVATATPARRLAPAAPSPRPVAAAPTVRLPAA